MIPPPPPYLPYNSKFETIEEYRDRLKKWNRGNIFCGLEDSLILLTISFLLAISTLLFCLTLMYMLIE